MNDQSEQDDAKSILTLFQERSAQERTAASPQTKVQIPSAGFSLKNRVIASPPCPDTSNCKGWRLPKPKRRGTSKSRTWTRSHICRHSGRRDVRRVLRDRQLPRSTEAVALTDCRLARMSASAFHATLMSNNGIAVRFSELFIAKIRNMSEHVFEVSALAVRERVDANCCGLPHMASPATARSSSSLRGPTTRSRRASARIGRR